MAAAAATLEMARALEVAPGTEQQARAVSTPHGQAWYAPPVRPSAERTPVWAAEPGLSAPPPFGREPMEHVLYFAVRAPAEGVEAGVPIIFRYMDRHRGEDQEMQKATMVVPAVPGGGAGELFLAPVDRTVRLREGGRACFIIWAWNGFVYGLALCLGLGLGLGRWGLGGGLGGALLALCAAVGANTLRRAPRALRADDADLGLGGGGGGACAGHVPLGAGCASVLPGGGAGGGCGGGGGSADGCGGGGGCGGCDGGGGSC